MAKTNILIVEDESIIAADIRNQLRRLGYTVVGMVASGEVAIEKSAETQPDLVMMDIMLKGELNGIEAAKQIRGRFNIPVVYLTAYADEDTLRRAKITEPFGYLIKPFEARELHSTIEMALHRHRMDEQLKAREQWLTTVLRGIGDAVITTDIHGHITFLNPVAETLTGWNTEAALGKELESVFQIIDEPTRAPAENLVTQVLRNGIVVGLVTPALLVSKDGTERPIDDNAAPIKDDDGNITGVVLVFRDVTEQREAAEKLRESEERYAIAARGANDGLWDWNLDTDELYFSPRWKDMLGYLEDEIRNHTDEWFSRVHPEDINRVRQEIAAHLDGLHPHFESKHRILHKDGAYRWMLCRGLAVRDDSRRAYRMAGSQTDVTDRELIEQKLRHHAYHDELTGLPNRIFFMEHLERSIARARRREGSLFAVLILDLDRFKVINDSLGHLIGDELLIQLGQRLSKCVRIEDVVARFGGDEFVILLDEIRENRDAQQVANRIHRVLEFPFDLQGHEVFTSASIGIVYGSKGYERPEDLLRDADLAMYHAKAQGRSRYEVFDGKMRTGAVMRLQLENDLRRAVERQEFFLNYQPIVSLETGQITSFEVLARWQHPERGLISPSEFIPPAEETGLIIPIGWWVLQEACQQMHRWHQQFPKNPPLAVNVNLSGLQLVQDDLVEQIDRILGETEFDPRFLNLEITESVVMDRAESTIDTLSQLKALNVQLHVDDFGTGYSSLSYLHRFPIDVLKVDRSFVIRMDVDEESSEIIRTIVALAHNIGIEVTAEGVETSAQLTQLADLKCKHAQGYFFSKPMDIQEAELLIHNGRRWIPDP